MKTVGKMPDLVQNINMTNEQALIAEIHKLPQSKQAEAVDAALRLIKNLAKQHSEKPVKKLRRPRAGSMPDLFKIGPDFDDPIPGFEEYM